MRHFIERGISYGRVVEAEEAPFVSAATTATSNGHALDGPVA